MYVSYFAYLQHMGFIQISSVLNVHFIFDKSVLSNLRMLYQVVKTSRPLRYSNRHFRCFSLSLANALVVLCCGLVGAGSAGRKLYAGVASYDSSVYTMVILHLKYVIANEIRCLQLDIQCRAARLQMGLCNHNYLILINFFGQLVVVVTEVCICRLAKFGRRHLPKS